MKRSLFAFILVICLVLPLFAACGGDEGSSSSLQSSITTEGSDTETVETSKNGAAETVTKTETIGGDEGNSTQTVTESEVITSEKVDDTTTVEKSEPDETSCETVSEGTETVESAIENSEFSSTDESETITEIDEVTEFEIKVSGNEAFVSTKHALEYSAMGYDSLTDSGFAFDNGLLLDLGDSFVESFNRFTMKYRSTAPLKIYLTYTESGKETEEYYFLEAGEGEFSGLTTSFLSGALGKSLVSIKIDTCENKTASFILLDLSTESIDVPEAQQYIVGSRYTLGIDLSWGGAINYVSDNTNKIDGLNNLINRFDTGRLVQQSYYGTNPADGIYEGGGDDGSWPYNPVQGGDIRRNGSRLIDFYIGDDRIYVKVQPLDWIKDNSITPSYMENEYIVCDDYIYVDNRFVDFSGMEHLSRSQELPAFYTVNYLDTFVWYNGIEPWSGDSLTYKSNLPFWSDEESADDCKFYLREKNTETWCAWINEGDNYGIGLYTPNIDRFTAGIYEADGSKLDTAASCSYVACINKMIMISYVPIEYSYIMAAGSVEEIRETFTKHKDFDDNSSFDSTKTSTRLPNFTQDMSNIDFTVESNASLLSSPNSTTVSYDGSQKAAKLTVTGEDPYVLLNFQSSLSNVKAEDHDYIEIVYMIPKTNVYESNTCQIFICAGENKKTSEDHSVKTKLVKDGEYHTLTVKVSELSYWSGDVHSLRLDYFGGASVDDTIYIKSFRMYK